MASKRRKNIKAAVKKKCYAAPLFPLKQKPEELIGISKLALKMIEDWKQFEVPPYA